MSPASVLALLVLMMGQGPSASPSPSPSPSPSSSCPPEERHPILELGVVVGAICPAAAAGLTIVELGDAWVPLILQDTPYHPTWVALADERFDVEGAGPRAAADRYLEQWGIQPNFSVLARRLDDAPRHACDALVRNEALAELRVDLRSSRPRPKKKGADDAVNALQGHLVCEGLLAAAQADGTFNAATARALSLWQRKEVLPGIPGVLDDEGRTRLLLPSQTRDLLAVLRSLRERVADAAGLIEDGSARAEQATVLGLLLDPPSLRPSRRPPSPRGAPDLIHQATDAAARALGLTESQLDVVGAHAALAATVRGWLLLGSVALRLPAPPAWHSAHMAELTAAVDVGDVNAHGVPVVGGARPVFRVSTVVDGEPLPLVVWPTTVGGNQREQLSSGEVIRKNKPSPRGQFVWRWLWAAPVWYPPPTTPDDELVLHSGKGVVVNDEGVGPGYRSAYGLVMLQHHTMVTTRDGTELFGDTSVRTHGTGTVRSVLAGGVSHGCHRLWPAQALRLGTFLLRHRQHHDAEPALEGYSRRLHVGGTSLTLERRRRGTRTELTPPVPIDVVATPRGR